MGVHKIVLKNDKIPQELFHLEVIASNDHSQVDSCTSVMIMLALDPPNDYKFNDHLFGNCPWVCTELC